MESRYAEIDIAKGLGIIAIALGHNITVMKESKELADVLFSFHVPLFFFLSGVFMNSDTGIYAYAIKKFHTCLKPYFVTLILLGFILIPFEGVNPVNYFAGILYGTGREMPWGWVQLWFLPHLFAVSVLSHILCGKTTILSRPFLFKILFLALILSIGYLGIDQFKRFFIPGTRIKLYGLPFSVDVILVSSFYFLLGNFLKNHVKNFKVNQPMLAFALVVFALLHFRFDYSMDLNTRRYDHLLISTLAALAGIYIVVSVSAILKGARTLSRQLAHIGSSSLFILIFHNYIQWKTAVLIEGLSGKESFGFVLVSITSLGAGVLIPILIEELVRKNRVLKMLFLPIPSIETEASGNTVRSSRVIRPAKRFPVIQWITPAGKEK